jgi:hypothetical protein
MNEKQADAMLKSLKRIESFLEAIDWKLWNFHQKVLGDGTGTESVNSTTSEDEETEQLAAVIESPKAKPVEETKKVSANVGYPTIEKWN